MSNATFLKEAFTQASEAVTAGAPIHAGAAAAHAANESAYGRSKLSTDANNFFGIKAIGSPTEFWDGTRVSMQTWEVINGQTVQTTAQFRQYKTWDLCFLDYGGIISRIYPSAVKGKGNALAFLAGLFLTGPYKWATDPAAFDKCARIYGLNHGLFSAKESDANGLQLRNLTLLDRIQVLLDGKNGVTLAGNFGAVLEGRVLVVSRE